MASIYCPECGTETDHVTITGAARSAQVTRTTIYNWLGRSLLHTVMRPSGRRLVCARSLVIYRRSGAGSADGQAQALGVLTF
jgi:hypothetical protein